MGNLGLCGNASGLSPSNANNANNSHKKQKKIIIAVVVSVFALLLLIAFLAGALVCGRKKQQHELETKISEMEESESLIWEKEGRITFRKLLRSPIILATIIALEKEGFGSVYKASLASGYIVAVKKLNMLESSSSIPLSSKQSFENEIRALTEIRHRNIINFSLELRPLNNFYMVLISRFQTLV
ncbi:MDIS1-interacting receptor like kinase 2-like [Silene latifolia]|uniref:MDIS1-interacting receptor like kinase 2-like n=1 Tax=Silene latifolia TaxID=37657 RepID=UPI003D76FBC0